jgi:hypothetical protein
MVGRDRAAGQAHRNVIARDTEVAVHIVDRVELPGTETRAIAVRVGTGRCDWIDHKSKDDGGICRIRSRGD